MLDTPRVVTTPEGIELTIKVAGPIARAQAWLVDLLIRAVAYIAFAIILSALGKFGMGIFAIFMFLLEWAYPVLFEVYWNGATPGKRACHLRVLHDNGTPIGWRASFTRNTIRAVDFLPSFYGFGLISMLFNRDFKRLGDLAAGTVVVYVERQAVSKRKAGKPGKTDNAIPLAAVTTQPLVTDGYLASTDIPSLTLAEQRAIIDYAERQKRWSDDRKVELALHAGVVLNGQQGQDAVTRLRGMADYFLGKNLRSKNGNGRSKPEQQAAGTIASAPATDAKAMT